MQMLFDAAQQPPPLHEFDAQPLPLQQPVPPHADAQSEMEAVLAPARSQPNSHERS